MFQARRATIGVIAAAMLAVALSTGAGAQGGSVAEIEELNRQALRLHEAGKYAEAAVAAEKGLALSERVLGKDHRETLTRVNNLASMYNALGRGREAEPLYRRALEGRLRVLGEEHIDTLTSVNNLAALYYGQGRYAEAEPLFKPHVRNGAAHARRGA